jgi:uncharacterized repeat protein (TIGR01451 family)
MARRHPAIRAPRRARRAGLASALFSLVLLLAQLGSLAAWAETPGRDLTLDPELEASAPEEPHEVPGDPLADAAIAPSPTAEPPSAAAPGPPCVARVPASTTCTPKLTITKVANVVASQVAPGAPFTYTVTVANAGPGSATGVTITDDLPSALVNPSATFSISAGPAQGCSVVGGDVTCAVGTLPQGASAVATISATAPRVCGPLSNVATVDTDQTKPLGSAPVAVTVAGCDLAIKKVATPSAVAPGGALTYTIVVRNEDVSAASGVVVTDTLPAGYAVVSAEHDVDAAGLPASVPCAVAGQTVTCAIGVLAPMGDPSGDDEALVRIVATAPATCGSAFNRATVHWGAGGRATSNSAKTTVAGCGLVIDKQGPASVALGGALSYAITVTNPNPEATTQPVTVTDAVPAPLGNVQASALLNGAPMAPNPCAVTGNAVSCAVGVLQAGDTVVISIDASAPSTSCPTLTNTASVSVGTLPGTSSPAVTTAVTGCAPNVTLDKSGPGQVLPGGSIAYTLTVTNTATADATNVVVADPVPSPLANVAATPSQGTCTVAGNQVTCAVGTLAPGQQETISITAEVPLGPCATIDNAATGSYDGGSLRSGTVQTAIAGCAPASAPQLALVKTADAAVVAPGQPLGFTIEVRNDGSADALGVTINDAIPAVPGIGWSVDGGTAATPCSLTGNSLHCAIGTLSAGEVRTVHVSSTPTTTQSCGTFTNFAIAASTNTPAARAQADVEVECPPGIDLEKDGPAFAYVGDTVRYAFVVRLKAGSPPLAVELTDPMCDRGTLRLVSKGGGDQDATLETGEAWRYACTHVVTTGDPDPLPNTATAIGTGPGDDPVADSDDHLIDIRHPDIDLEKEADPPAGAPGASITYTYTVTNSGDVPLHDLSVDDDILGHVCDVRVLRPGETVVCIGTYTIPAGANISITNIAIAGGTDPGERYVSDEDDETIDVVLGATVTPPPTRTPPVGLAFTGSGLALVLGALGVLLLVVGSGLLWLGHRLRRPAR